MKKLTLKKLNLESGEILSRDELKEILSDSPYAGAGSGSGSRRGSGSRKGSGSGSHHCVKRSPYPKIRACECQEVNSECTWIDANGTPHHGICKQIMSQVHCSDPF